MAQNSKQSSLIQAVGLRPKVLVPTLEKMFQAHLPVLLVGKPGIGKTDMVVQAAENIGFDLMISHPVVSDPTDYKGMPCVVDGEAHFLPFGDLRQLLVAEKPTISFLDDLGQAPPSVQAACMQLILARQINGHKISEHIAFAAATNRKADKAGVSGILEPVKSRFASILNIMVHTEDWIKWAYKHQMPTELIAYINFKPKHLDDFQPTSEIVNSPCPRTVANVGKLLTMGLEAESEFALVEGAAGTGFATEFTAFRKMFGRLPDPRKVLAEPKKYTKQLDIKQLDVMVATVVAVAEIVEKKSMSNFIEFIDNLPSREYSVMGIKMIETRDEACNMGLVDTREYSKWITEHLDICM